MQPSLSATDYRILDLLFHYGLAFSNDIASLLGFSKPHIHARLQKLLESTHLHRRRIPGGKGRRYEAYSLTESGYLFMRDQFDYPNQYIENYDLRLEELSDGFIKHECLVAHAAAQFQAYKGSSTVHDRRTFLSHLPSEAKQARTLSKILQLEIQSAAIAMNHRADDILYIERAGHRPTVVFIEIDRGTESARDKHGRPRGKVSKMFNIYIDAYREKYYRRYFGSDVKPVVLFILSTAWSAETRKQNFIDLWSETGQGEAKKLPTFTTLDEFNQIDPFELI